MKRLQNYLITPNILLFGLLLVVIFFGIKSKKVSAACAAQPTDYGSSTITTNIPATSTYRVWSRIMAPDSTNNSYLLEVDGGSCITVGDSAITANIWTWVSYQNGSSASNIDLPLTAGNHTFKMIGREPNVKLDLVIFTADTTCHPIDLGTNCSSPVDNPPTVSLASPANNATVSGNVNLTALANDDVGVTKVEFRVDGTLVNTDTTNPYSYSWNSASVGDGLHGITAKAYDTASQSTTSAPVTTVNVSQAPPPPTKSGDVNGDNAVNIFDLSILAANWGGSSKTRGQGDLNNDTVVNVFDLSILAANWGL